MSFALVWTQTSRSAEAGVSVKALTHFKDRIREITRQAKGVSIETTVKRLATYMVGWRGYFGFCETPRC